MKQPFISFLYCLYSSNVPKSQSALMSIRKENRKQTTTKNTHLFLLQIRKSALNHEFILFRLLISDIAKHQRDLTSSCHARWNDPLDRLDHELFWSCRFYFVRQVAGTVGVLNL
tara:strand:+ start:140 stop:481 length:342 start_codon:yes stop_codon:yes gene_type:complete